MTIDFSNGDAKYGCRDEAVLCFDLLAMKLFKAIQGDYDAKRLLAALKVVSCVRFAFVRSASLNYDLSSQTLSTLSASRVLDLLLLSCPWAGRRVFAVA